jgi:hypothetical protein
MDLTRTNQEITKNKINHQLQVSTSLFNKHLTKFKSKTTSISLRINIAKFPHASSKRFKEKEKIGLLRRPNKQAKKKQTRDPQEILIKARKN